MRTGCDPLEDDRAEFALPEGTPLLLPLKRCQPPDCVAEDGAVCVALEAAGAEFEGAGAAVCGKPALGPPEDVDPLLVKGWVARVIAWRCWSNDT